jgi:hypothetical protein
MRQVVRILSPIAGLVRGDQIPQPTFLKDRVARRRQMALPARRTKDSRVSGMPTYRESGNSSGTQQECHWESRSSEGLRNAGQTQEVDIHT